MEHEFYRVASLRIAQPAQLTLGELCLVLNLFPTFPPEYKLNGEQCYWFCNIVLAAIRAGCGNIPLVE
jgi:hypothetical protein